MMPVITMLYAGLLALIAVVIASFPGRRRASLDISVGHGGDVELELGMRRHANFVEAVPLALILFALIEMNGAPPLGVHCLGAVLVAARITHALGMNAKTTKSVSRGLGAGASALVTIIAACWGIWLFASALG